MVIIYEIDRSLLLSIFCWFCLFLCFAFFSSVHLGSIFVFTFLVDIFLYKKWKVLIRKTEKIVRLI